MEKKIRCNNCGAEFDASLPKCPYCGGLNIIEAEKKYMENLDDIKEDLKELESAPVKETAKTLSITLKMILKVVIIASIIFLGLFLMLQFKNREKERNINKEILWEKQNFPVWDQLYDDGEYEKLEDLFIRSFRDDRTVWNWNHYEFINYYDYIHQVKILTGKESNGITLSKDDYIDLFYFEIYLESMSCENRKKFVNYPTEEELSHLKKLFEPYKGDLDRRFSISEEEKNSFFSEMENGGTIEYQKILDYVNKWYDINKKAE